MRTGGPACCRRQFENDRIALGTESLSPFLHMGEGKAHFPEDDRAALSHIVEINPWTDNRPAMHDHMGAIRRIDRDIVGC